MFGEADRHCLGTNLDPATATDKFLMKKPNNTTQPGKQI